MAKKTRRKVNRKSSGSSNSSPPPRRRSYSRRAKTTVRRVSRRAHRSYGRRAGSTKPTAMIMQMATDAGVGTAGFLGVQYAADFIASHVPQVSTGYAKVAAKAGIVLALTMLARKFAPKYASPLAAGGAVSVGLDLYTRIRASQSGTNGVQGLLGLGGLAALPGSGASGYGPAQSVYANQYAA